MPRSSHSALGSRKNADTNGQTQQIPSKRQKNGSSSSNHWADGLMRFLEDPDDPSVVYVDDEIIAVKDKYPKAKHHYLVMPRDTKYSSAKNLTRDDVELLKRMENVANKLVHDNNENGEPSLQYRYGFHAVPSMKHLHMHVISQDFDSPCLKNKKHWNSFTTTFFVPIEEMMIAVEKGDVDFSYRENRLKDGLKCHRCGRAQLNLPELKRHIAGCTCSPFAKSD